MKHVHVNLLELLVVFSVVGLGLNPWKAHPQDINGNGSQGFPQYIYIYIYLGKLDNDLTATSLE